MRHLSLKTLLLSAAVIFSTACKRERDEVSPGRSSSDRTASVASITSFDYVITASQNVVDASSLNLKEGAVIGIEGGTRGSLLIRNLHGSPTAPITIVNKGSKALIKTTGSYGLKFENSTYLHVSGTGVSGTEYGIEIDGAHIGLSMDKLTTNFEIDHLQIHNIGFAGVMAKTDPSCDQATWRENFTMRDVNIHHNYVHHCGGEGLYIGNSFYATGRDLSCGSIKPHSIEGLRVYQNKIAYTDAEGIQVGCAIKDAEVYDNTVDYFGQNPFANHQNNGIQIGEGSGGKLYNNVIKNGPGNGIIMLGTGDNVVYNNIVVNPGGNGVFCDERYTPHNGFTFANNTIINPGGDGFKMYSEKVPMNTIVNNIVIKPGSGQYITSMGSPRITESNNHFNADINTVKFLNAAGGDYTLVSGSPCIDKGANVASFGVNIDCHFNARPVGAGYDIGAFEFGGTTSGTTPTTGTTPIAPTEPTVPTEPTTPTTGTTAGQVKAIDDAFLQSGTLYNNKDLRVEAGKRVSYLKFNVSSAVTSAKLRLAVGSDNGHGTVRIYKGSHNNWTQTTLSSSTAPVSAGAITSLKGRFDMGKTYDFDVTNAITGPGTYTFLVMMDAGGNDVSFSSSENAVVPVLVVSSATSGGTTAPTAPTSPTAPTAPTSPTTGVAVNSITLIDAVKNTELMTIPNGGTINLATIGTTKFNFRANTTASTGSVRFAYNGNANYRTESYAPYAMFGDSYPTYNGNSLSTGAHTISVTPFTESAATGTKGATYTVNFTVVNGTSTTTPTAPTAPTAPTTPTIPATSGLVNAKFLASADAYLQGSTGYNLSDLRVENNRRDIAIKFTVSGLGTAPASKAKLRLQVSADPGNGTIRAYTASHNNWSESSLSRTSMPAAVTQIGSVNSTYNSGNIVEIDVTKAIKGDGTYTIILKKDSGGNDVSFKSKEGGFAPELIIN